MKKFASYEEALNCMRELLKGCKEALKYIQDSKQRVMQSCNPKLEAKLKQTIESVEEL